MAKTNIGNSTFLVNYKGEDLHLRYDFNRVCDMEEVCGKDISQIMNSGYTGIRILVLWGLKDNKKMDAYKAGDIISHIIENHKIENEEGGLEFIVAKIREVLEKGKFIQTEDSKKSEDDDDDEDDSKKNS